MRKKRVTQPARKLPSTTAPRIIQNLEDLRSAKREWSSRLLKRRAMPASRMLMAAVTPDPAWNLQGVGIGEKLVDSRHTGIMAVKFLVRAKYHEGHVSKKHALPKSISGLPTDVEEVGLFRRFRAAVAPTAPPDPRSRIRPALWRIAKPYDCQSH